MSATIISFGDEVKCRNALREAHQTLWAGLQPMVGPSDRETIRRLDAIVTPDARALAEGSSRLAHALRKVIAILDGTYPTPRARIDALWEESDLDEAWFRKALGLPEGLQVVKGPSDHASA